MTISVSRSAKKKAKELSDDKINVSAICEAAILQAYQEYIQNGVVDKKKLQ